jgi:hypothetical protein
LQESEYSSNNFEQRREIQEGDDPSYVVMKNERGREGKRERERKRKKKGEKEKEERESGRGKRRERRKSRVSQWSILCCRSVSA